VWSISALVSLVAFIVVTVIGWEAMTPLAPRLVASILSGIPLPPEGLDSASVGRAFFFRGDAKRFVSGRR
jgi:hypothetical protein